MKCIECGRDFEPRPRCRNFLCSDECRAIRKREQDLANHRKSSRYISKDDGIAEARQWLINFAKRRNVTCSLTS